MEKDYILFKTSGKFINAYKDDAYILNYLFNYKIVNNKVGFPTTSLNKVINTLEENSISYKLGDTFKDFNNANKYNKFLKNAISVVNTRNRYATIENSLKVLSVEQINRVIDLIEELLNE